MVTKIRKINGKKRGKTGQKISVSLNLGMDKVVKSHTVMARFIRLARDTEELITK